MYLRLQKPFKRKLFSECFSTALFVRQFYGLVRVPHLYFHANLFSKSNTYKLIVIS